MSKQSCVRASLRALTVASAALVVGAPAALARTHQTRVKSHSRAVPDLVLGPHVQTAGSPPTSAQCKAEIGIACYGPQDMRNEYDFNPTYAPGNGDAGAGQTIVIFDSFGSPTINQDLAAFDTAYGINPPPSFNIYQPEGNVTYPYLTDGAAAQNSFKDKTEINRGV